MSTNTDEVKTSANCGSNNIEPVSSSSLLSLSSTTTTTRPSTDNKGGYVVVLTVDCKCALLEVGSTTFSTDIRDVIGADYKSVARVAKSAKRIAMLARKEDADDIGMNDSAAYMMKILGFSARSFGIAAVRGTIVICGSGGAQLLTLVEAQQLQAIHAELVQNSHDCEEGAGEEDDSIFHAQLRVKFASLFST